MSEFVLPRGRSMIDQPPDRYSGRHVVNPAITPEVEPEANPEVLDARPSPLEWMRSRRVVRENRRADAVHQRTADRMRSLGTDWRILDLQAAAGSERMNFLAVGPGGVFAVTVKDHGRSRVNFAGEVVQVDGRRPKYVQEARRNAKRAGEALSRTARLSVPVTPVLAFAG